MIREVKSDCLPIAGVSRVGADSGSRGVVGSSRVYRLMGTKLVVDSKGVHLDGERDELTVEMGVYNKGGGGGGGEKLMMFDGFGEGLNMGAKGFGT